MLLSQMSCDLSNRCYYSFPFFLQLLQFCFKLLLGLAIASGTAIQFIGAPRNLGYHSFCRVKAANEVVFSLNAPADE